MDLVTLERLDRLDGGPIRFCAAVFACTWFLKIFVAYSLLSERPDNVASFPLISYNDGGERMILARPALTGFPCELEDQLCAMRNTAK